MKVLIVEDHHLMTEGYKMILQETTRNCQIDSVTNSSDAINLISDTSNSYDYYFIDIGIPPYPEAKIFDGLDLALRIRNINRNSKIVILTSHEEALILYKINNKVQPEAFLVKSDLDVIEFKSFWALLLEDEIYKSKSVRNALKKITETDFYLDNLNREIILLLSQGVKTKHLPRYIPLSISAIDKRKAQLKDFFQLDRGCDEDIVTEARKCGLI